MTKNLRGKICGMDDIAGLMMSANEHIDLHTEVGIKLVNWSIT